MANYNPIVQQYQQFQNAPPEIEQGALDLFQRQQLAQMLMQRGMEPMGDTQYTHSGGGQWAAPPQAIKQGWGQGLAKLGQVAAGAYMNKQAGDEQKALAQQLRTQNQSETSAIMDANSGTPAQPMGPPTEDGQMGMREAIAPNRDMATALMMGSTNPDWKAVGKHRLMETPKQDNLIVPPNSVVLGPDGKLRFTAPPAPEKPQYENADPLEKLLAFKASLPPDSPNLPAVNNRIRLLSETPKQIVPAVTGNQPPKNLTREARLKWELDDGRIDQNTYDAAMAATPGAKLKAEKTAAANSAELGFKAVEDNIAKLYDTKTQTIKEDANSLFGKFDQYRPQLLMSQETVDAGNALDSLTNQVMMSNLADAKERVGQSFGSMQVQEWDKFTQQLTSLKRGLSPKAAADALKYVDNFIQTKRGILKAALGQSGVTSSGVPSGNQPPPAAIAELKLRGDKAQFDAVFGAGAADRALKEQ